MKRNTVVEQLYLLAFCVGLADVLWLPADVASRLTLMDLFSNLDKFQELCFVVSCSEIFVCMQNVMKHNTC